MYVGDFKNGKKDGFGVYKWSDGSVLKAGMLMIRKKDMGNSEQLITNCLKGSGKTERDKAKALY